MDTELRMKSSNLRDMVRGMNSVLVAYSGGVDSALVLKVASEELGDRALGVIGISPSLAEEELEQARACAQAMGARLRECQTHEFEHEGYAANQLNRCYFCKQELYTRLLPLAHEEGCATIVNGFHLDDLGDFRPGQRAGDELGIRSPLREAEFRKEDVRALSKELGLRVWDKPASPCLSSRVAFGLRVTPEVVRMVAEAERRIRAIVPGLVDLRVRHLGLGARIEVELARLPDVTEAFPRLPAALQALGYQTGTVDPAGYRRGALVKQGAS